MYFVANGQISPHLFWDRTKIYCIFPLLSPGFPISVCLCSNFANFGRIFLKFIWNRTIFLEIGQGFFLAFSGSVLPVLPVFVKIGRLTFNFECDPHSKIWACVYFWDQSQKNQVGDVRSQKTVKKHQKNSGNSGPTPMAHGGSGKPLRLPCARIGW